MKMSIYTEDINRMGEDRKIKTVEVYAKQWFDKANGNSYFSAHVIVDRGTDTEKTLLVPFEYGYGSQYEYSAFQAIKNEYSVGLDETVPWKFYSNNGIFYVHVLTENCKKRDVIAYGLNP